MGKAAGILKKIKEIAKTTGSKLHKAASWVNENILKPGGKIAKPLIDMFDPTGIGSKVYDGLTKVIDYSNEYLNYVPDNSFANTTEFLTDIAIDTQRGKNERKYKDPFDTAIKLHNEVSNSKRDYESYLRVKNDAKRMKDMKNKFEQALVNHYVDEYMDEYEDEYSG